MIFRDTVQSLLSFRHCLSLKFQIELGAHYHGLFLGTLNGNFFLLNKHSIFKQPTQAIFTSTAYYKNCAELYNCGQTISGVYTIDPDGKGAFNVHCDQTTDGGGWTVFQRRLDGCMDFNLGWADYKKGFGDFLIGEFWLGLEKIHRLTQNETENRLRVDLGVTKRKTVYAEYLWFGIGDKKDNYRLKLGTKSSESIYFLSVIII